MFRSPTPRFYGPKEAWQLTCEDEEGRVRAMRDVVVDRGDRIDVGRVCSRAAIARGEGGRLGGLRRGRLPPPGPRPR